MQVSATDLDGERRSAPVGDDGAYALSLAPGCYRLEAGSTEAGSVEQEVQLNPWEPERRLDLRLEISRELVVRVVNVRAVGGDGAPPEGLSAAATREPPGEWLLELTANPYDLVTLGRFHPARDGPLADGTIGRLLLEVPPPVYVSLARYQRVLATQRVEEGEAEVVFELDLDPRLLEPVDLRFRFVDAVTLEPVVPRTCFLQQGRSGIRFLRPEDGEFRHATASPGLYGVQARTPDYAAEPYALLVEPSLSGQLLDIPLEPAVAIAGVVVDEEGEGVGTALRVEPLDEATGLPVTTHSVTRHRTEKDGRFHIGGLKRGVYLVRPDLSSLEFGRTCVRVDTRGALNDLLRIELRPGVPLRLRASDDAWVELRWRVLDARGELVTFGRLWDDRPRPIPLAPGAYTVESRVGDAEPARHEVTIAGDPVDLELP
jgi:hypothetical protein